MLDDGRGFDPSSTRAGVGLSAMRERVEAGGGIEIKSPPGGGTEVALKNSLGAVLQLLDVYDAFPNGVDHGLGAIEDVQPVDVGGVVPDCLLRDPKSPGYLPVAHAQGPCYL